MTPNNLNICVSSILFGLVAALLASTNLFVSFNTLVYFSHSSLSSISLIIPPLIRRSHRHHRRHKDAANKTSICDSFPPDFPPPDTNTTSFLCVDANGCCNFTTVQAAVDAVGVMSPKRNIIWINTGVYL